MPFLLDTTIFLEAMRRDPDAAVVAWLQEVDEDDTFISVLTIADLENHIRYASDPDYKQLRRWLRHNFTPRFRRRLLPIGRRIVETYAEIVNRSEALCCPLELREALIAATAEVHGLALVTCDPAQYRHLVSNVISLSSTP
jgi:toxin FitB